MPYAVEAQAGSALADVHYRIADGRGDRVATCYLEENARLVARLMNAGELVPQLLAACKAALADYETINAAARVAGIHPFTIGPAQLRAAIGAAERQ